MVYFVQPVGGGPVKIGHSEHVKTRIRVLEWRFGVEFVLLHTMDGGREKEAEIHDRFSHLRFRRTEQFRPAAELMEFIGKPLPVDPEPDAVEKLVPPQQLSKIVQIPMHPEMHKAIKMAALRADLTVGAWLHNHLCRTLDREDLLIESRETADSR